MKYQSYDPNAEINGQAILGFKNSLNRNAFSPLLEKHGLLNAEPQGWYPLQNWLDVLNDIALGQNRAFDFVSVGMALSDNIRLPEQRLSADELGQFLVDRISGSLQGYLRGGYVGEVHAESSSSRHIVFRLRMPFPSDLMYGTTRLFKNFKWLVGASRSPCKI